MIVNDDLPDLENYVKQVESVSQLSEVTAEPRAKGKQVRILARVDNS